MAAGGVAAAAIAQAIRASGVVLSLRSDEFRKILLRMPDPLVVVAEGGSSHPGALAAAHQDRCDSTVGLQLAFPAVIRS